MTLVCLVPRFIYTNGTKKPMKKIDWNLGISIHSKKKTAQKKPSLTAVISFEWPGLVIY